MLWNKLLIILAIELVVGFVLGKFLIPYFRKLKTGRFDIYIGSRFEKDDSTPKFGGAIVALILVVGLFLGTAIVSSTLELGQPQMIDKILTGAIFAVLLMIIGLIEDYKKDRKSKILGFKMCHKVYAEIMLSFGFLFIIYLFGDHTQSVLLPFRLGYINFSILYYPLMAIFMTVGINMVKLHDCFGGNVKDSCDGLCSVSMMIFSLTIAICCNITGNTGTQIFAYCVAGAVGGLLIWELSPAKINLGESGSMLYAGLATALSVLSEMHLIFVFAGLGFVIDSICSTIQYVVYRKNKKLIFKGNSLHSHLTAKGWNDYKVITLFSIINIIGSAGAIAFAVYKTKL